MNLRLILLSIAGAAGVASLQFLIERPATPVPQPAAAVAMLEPVQLQSPTPPRVELPSTTPQIVEPQVVQAALPQPAASAVTSATEAATPVAASRAEMELAAVTSPPAEQPAAVAAKRPAAAQPACGRGETASEQILRLSSRVQAEVAAGDLMPWDAREISDSLRGASQLLRERDIDKACTTLVQAERRFRSR